jgi:hypothetical protein
MRSAYITRVPIESDQQGAPTAWFRVYVDDIEITDGQTPAGRPRWFTSLDDAMAAVSAAMQTDAHTTLTCVPQYDSAFTEAVDEPVGYVLREAT